MTRNYLDEAATANFRLAKKIAFDDFEYTKQIFVVVFYVYLQIYACSKMYVKNAKQATLLKSFQRTDSRIYN